MAFITATNSDALIPTEDARQIIQSAVQNSAAMQRFRTVNMGTKTQRMPVMSALVAAAFVSGPSGSSAPGRKPTSNMAWERKTLTAEEIAVIVPIPEDILDDSDYDIWGEVRPRISEAIGAVLDAAVLYGTNKPASWTDDPLVTLARDAGNSFVRGSVADQLLDVDISDTMGLVEADGFDVNGMIAGVQLRGSLRGLRDSTGQPIFIQSPRVEGVGPDNTSIYGVGASFLKNGAWDTGEADLLVGDFDMAILGIRQDIRYKLLTEAVIQAENGDILYNLAQNDMVAIRAVFRAAYVAANPITRLNTSGATRSPFAVLRPAGASA